MSRTTGRWALGAGQKGNGILGKGAVRRTLSDRQSWKRARLHRSGFSASCDSGQCPEPSAQSPGERATRRWRTFAVAVLLMGAGAASFGASYDEELLAMKRDLPAAYKPDQTQTIAALEALTARAEAFATANPGRSEALVWHASMLTKLSGARRNMSSLGLAKQARKQFDAAQKIDPKAMDWSAKALLAQLYWHVPGWPVGFGDEKDAQKLFEGAVALNPTGAEPHYFYAEFLIDKKRHAEAVRHLEIARTAPLRVGEEPDSTGFSCNAMRCMTHTPETDGKFRAAVETRMAKAKEGMAGG